MNIVISGPSGAGKGTVIELLQNYMGFEKSVSVTTRPIREGEINNENYSFVKKDEFKSLINNDFFFEFVEYGGNFYGIPNKNITDINSNRKIIFDLVPTSGINLKRNFPNTCLIYVIPENEEELTKRRGNRGEHRVEYDKEQLEYAKEFYDYIIINDDLEKTMTQLLAVLNVFEMNSIDNNKGILDNYFHEEAKCKVLQKN